MSELVITDQEARLIEALDENIEDSFANGVSDGSEVLPALTGYDKLNTAYRSLARKGVESTLAPLVVALRETAPTYNEPELLNGFSNYGNGYQPMQWYLDWTGEVVIRGYVATPGNPYNQVLFELPPEMAPEYNQVFTTIADGALCAITVFSDGQVICTQLDGGGSSYMTVNIRFRPG